MTLVNVISKFQEVTDDQRKKLDRTWEELKEDSSSSVAASIVQAVEMEEIYTKKDLYELMESIKDYKTREVDTFLDIGYEYSFKPPSDEFPVEYADALHKPRILTLTEEGTWMEVDDAGNFIGPVDRDHNPTEGHPEFDNPKEFTKLELPSIDKNKPYIEVPSRLIPQDILDNWDDHPQGSEESLIPFSKPPMTSVTPEPSLKEVFLDTDIGSLLFEPEHVIRSGHAFVMIFNTTRSKPPLYPRMGSKFRLKYNNESLPVTYMDISFSFRDRKFIVFIVLDEED